MIFISIIKLKRKEKDFGTVVCFLEIYGGVFKEKKSPTLRHRVEK